MKLYNKKVILLILSATVIRCLIAGSIEFGNDEAYYWVYSQQLQWNYFDHPPMVAFMIRLFTFNLYLQQYELMVRLGSVICSAFATYFIFKTVETIHSSRAGFFAAILYTTSLYSSLLAGVFVLPDSPQMFFWTASLYVLSKIINAKRINFSRWKSINEWLLFGLFTGLTFMSKIHGVFLWSGLAFYIIFFKRVWFKNPALYISILICFIITIPFFWWNFQNDFITYLYHSQRVEVHSVSFNSTSFLREIFGEIFYNNPVNFIITLLAVLQFFKTRAFTSKPYFTVSLLIALPMIGLLIGIAMFNDTLPHWSGPAYVTLIPLSAIYLEEQFPNTGIIPGLLKWSSGLFIFIIIAGVFVINFYPGTLSNKKELNNYGSGDVTLDMYGWNKAATIFDSVCKANVEKNIMHADAPIICNKWFPASHIEYYIARPLHKELIGLGTLNDLHQFEWLNYNRYKQGDLKEAWCMVPSNYSCNVQEEYGKNFTEIASIGTFPVYRNGMVARYFSIYYLKGFTGTVPCIK